MHVIVHVCAEAVVQMCHGTCVRRGGCTRHCTCVCGGGCTRVSWYMCVQRRLHTHVIVHVCAEAGGVGYERVQREGERNAIFKRITMNLLIKKRTR